MCQVKVCGRCGVEKPITDFHKQSRGLYGVAGRCKVCVNQIKNSKEKTPEQKAKAVAYAKRWRETHKPVKSEKVKEYQKLYRERNREVLKEKNRTYHAQQYLENKERILAKCKEWRNNNKEKVKEKDRRFHANWIATHGVRYESTIDPAKKLAKNKRREAVKKHVAILDNDSDNKKVIHSIYDIAKMLEVDTGIKWHVDHIIPMQGKIVRGFHVWYNLQVIPASVNISKSNSVNGDGVFDVNITHNQYLEWVLDNALSYLK